MADIAIAGTGVDLQLVAVTTDGEIWHIGRKTDDTWLGIGDVESQTSNPGTVVNLTAA